MLLPFFCIFATDYLRSLYKLLGLDEYLSRVNG